MTKLYIPLILGTNREGRNSERVATFVQNEIEKRDDMETKLFDTRDFDLPQDKYGQDIKELFPEYVGAAHKADGYILIVPEYNHGYPGRLKTVLDLLLKEYIHRPTGLVGVSAGMWGGVRAIENLVPVLRELGMTPTFTDLNFPRVTDALDEKGVPSDEKTSERAQGFLDELSWMGQTFRWGRENVPSKHHQ